MTDYVAVELGVSLYIISQNEILKELLALVLLPITSVKYVIFMSKAYFISAVIAYKIPNNML